MALLVLAVSRARKGPESELNERYVKRILPLARAQGFGSCTLRSFPESRKSEVAARQAEEAGKLEAALILPSYLFALDEKGKNFTSRDFALTLAKLRDNGEKNIAFVIGGPDGLASSMKERAKFLLAFGAMTWPHQLACAMLMEQIYRSLATLAGHPYHRD